MEVTLKLGRSVPTRISRTGTCVPAGGAWSRLQFGDCLRFMEMQFFFVVLTKNYCKAGRRPTDMYHSYEVKIKIEVPVLRAALKIQSI